MVDLEPQGNRLLSALRLAHIAIEARKEQALRELDLLPAHYGVLYTVWKHPGATGAELARRMGVTPQNVANLVGRMLERGLLERRPHATHGHVLEVRLTERGSAALLRADSAVGEVEEAAVAMLGAARTEEVARALDELHAAFARR